MIENGRILVVDDDPGVSNSYKEILTPTSAEKIIVEGASLFEAGAPNNERISRKRYDLTLVDRGEKAVAVVEKSVT